jgi:hypothetical protein
MDRIYFFSLAERKRSFMYKKNTIHCNKKGQQNKTYWKCTYKFFKVRVELSVLNLENINGIHSNRVCL